MSLIPNINNQSIAILSDIESWKEDIADAIKTKGGNSTPDESFQQLASDIQTLPYAGISAEGIVQTDEFSFLKYITTYPNNEVTEINDSEITTISKDNAFFNNLELREVVMSGVSTISGSFTFSDCVSLQSAQLPNLSTISGGNTFSNCVSLQSVQLPNLSTISGFRSFYGCTSLQNVVMSNLSTISGSNTFFNCTLLKTVTFGVLIVFVETFNNSKPNLRNITIGQGTDINLPFQYWTATNVIAEGQSGINELNSNLYNNLLTKLYDHSNDGETRILQIGWLDYVTPENIAYANAKGWTITN